MAKNIVITGGTGYIGSHVAKALKVKGGYDTIIIDRERRDHVMPFADCFVQSDYASKEMIDVLNKYNPDAIIHCAGTSLVGPSVENPSEYYVNNVGKTAMFLEWVRLLPKRPAVVFSSSAAVYGQPAVDLIKESTPQNPMSPYGWSKFMIEQMLRDHGRAYGTPYINLRYFNACGADPLDCELGQEPGATHIFAKILEAKLNNRPFVINGGDFNTPDGTCVRDYVHVWDLAQAHILAVEHLLAGRKSGSCNLGTGKCVSNREIADAVTKQVGEMMIGVGDRRVGDPDRLVADATLANQILGWYPQHSDIETIIETAWAWYNR